MKPATSKLTQEKGESIKMVILQPITNADIESFISRNNVKYFKGVFSADNIFVDVNMSSNFIIVCNLSKEFEEGSHFITIAHFEGELFYLDSLAINITKYNHIISFIKQIPINNFITLNTPIQSMSSNGCGYYCIFFILYFNILMSGGKNEKMKQFSKTDLTRNDDICIYNINKLIKK